MDERKQYRDAIGLCYLERRVTNSIFTILFGRRVRCVEWTLPRSLRGASTIGHTRGRARLILVVLCCEDARATDEGRKLSAGELIGPRILWAKQIKRMSPQVCDEPAQLTRVEGIPGQHHYSLSLQRPATKLTTVHQRLEACGHKGASKVSTGAVIT